MSTLGKRKPDDVVRPNKRQRQREQKTAARQIRTQPAQQQHHPTSGADGDAQKDKGRVIKLPGQIQVEKAISTYAFEIRSLQNAIKSAPTGSSIRAWQMLPRHKRRRNASHNLLALPKRLRGKGLSELRASNTAPRSRAETRRRRGKGERMSIGVYPRRKENVRRQALIQRAYRAAISDRAWLETHLWFAKRFRLSSKEGKVVGGKELPTPDRWGFTLPEESSTKSYRSTWRDAKRDATIMDMSYLSWIRVTCSVRAVDESSMALSAISDVLRSAGLQSGWQESWRDGSRCCRTTLCKPVKVLSEDEKHLKEYIRCHAPAQVFWLAGQTSSSSAARKRVEVLICTHPAATSVLDRALRTAIVATSRLNGRACVNIDRMNSIPHPTISAGSSAAARMHGKGDTDEKPAGTVPDLTTQYMQSLQRKCARAEAYNVFRIGGPTAGRLLLKTLRPVNAEKDGRLEAFLSSSTTMDGAVLAINVHDPRLSFPPRMPSRDKGQTKVASVDAAPSLPKHSKLLADGFHLPTFRKGEIDRRRSKLTTPGARLLPTSKDDNIPIVLVAHQDTPSTKSFDILLPRGWAQPFWLSLVHPGTRVVGQVQHRALNFDRGRPTFPCDVVNSAGYSQEEEAASRVASDQWDRRPPAKRCNFNKVGTRWPFGGSPMWTEIVRAGCAIAGLESCTPDKRAAWTFSPSTNITLEYLTDAYAAWKASEGGSTVPPIFIAIQSALVCVKLTACRKGTFAVYDELHHLTPDQRGNWTSAFEVIQKDKSAKGTIHTLEDTTRSSSTSHVGSITTSNFSLSQGSECAIASMSLLAYLDTQWQAGSLHPARPVNGADKSRNPINTTNLVLVKSTQGGKVRAASVSVIGMTPISM